MTSKPLIVAEAAGRDLNPRVGFISRLSARDRLPPRLEPVACPRPGCPGDGFRYHFAKPLDIVDDANIEGGAP